MKEDNKPIRYLWWKEQCPSFEHSCCHYVGHKCLLKNFAAAGRKDLLLCSDLHLGMIRHSFSSTPPPPAHAWWGVDGRGFSKITLILGCILSSARVHRSVSRFSSFIHAVVVCCTRLLSLTRHSKHSTGRTSVVDTVLS